MERVSTFDWGNHLSPDIRFDDVYDWNGQYLGRVTVTATFNGGTSATLTNAAPGVSIVQQIDPTIEEDVVVADPGPSYWYEGLYVTFQRQRFWTGFYLLKRTSFDEWGLPVTEFWNVNGVERIGTVGRRENYVVSSTTGD